jgi:ketosteroid isomerase-like protein
VTVVDDVAIINCYARVLTRRDGALLESTYRLHNTWKKEDGRWLLLATCNATVEEGKPVK